VAITDIGSMCVVKSGVSLTSAKPQEQVVPTIHRGAKHESFVEMVLTLLQNCQGVLSREDATDGRRVKPSGFSKKGSRYVVGILRPSGRLG